MWILSCTASVGYLSRMTQWKSKMAVHDTAKPFDTPLQLGLFSYPVLQAADILVHRATHVPVGEDQAQHLEFARNCAAGFNSVHGKILVEPETVLCMSSSVKPMAKKLIKSSTRKAHHVSHQPSEEDVQVRHQRQITHRDH
jgi:tryptophanyl-tRNA synthetase